VQHGINIEETADPQPVPRGQSYLNLTGTVGRLLGRRQSIRLDLNWQECRHFPARTEPWIAAPHKHHVGVKTMATGNR
jgi:hypothetical protein